MAEVKQKVAHCLKRQRGWFGCLGVEVLVCLDAGSGHWMDGWMGGCKCGADADAALAAVARAGDAVVKRATAYQDVCKYETLWMCVPGCVLACTKQTFEFF